MVVDRRNRGFTLIEMLAALAVLGVIMLLLGQGMQFGMLAAQREDRTLAGVGDLDAVDRLLRRLVSRIDAGGMYATAPRFVGTPHAVEFTSAMPVAMAGGAAHEADITLTARAGTGFELSWRPHLRRPCGPQAKPSQPQILPGVVQLDLAYAGADAVWRTNWRETALPRLIRIRVVFAQGDARRWPDLILAPMRDAWRP